MLSAILALAMPSDIIGQSQKSKPDNIVDSDCPTPELRAYRIKYTNQYVNRNYGYSVVIPKGMVGLGATYGAPNHGFTICFRNHHGELRGSLWVSAQYDASFFGSVEKIVHFDVAEIKGEHPDMHLTKKQTETFQGLPAIRTVARYHLEGGPGAVLEETITAFRRRPNEDAGIEYSIGLRTTNHHYRDDVSKLQAMAKSFHLLPAPK